MSSRFLPTLSQLRKATQSLPDPDVWPQDSYVIPVGDSETSPQLTFRRIKFTQDKEEGTSVHRWVYEGKIMIRSRDSGRKSSSSSDDGEADDEEESLLEFDSLFKKRSKRKRLSSKLSSRSK